MLFALRDYLLYRARRGRFHRHAATSVMGRAFIGSLPGLAQDMLAPGDALFISTYSSLLAWSIMYLTSSEIDHVAIWLGDGRIAHATLSGLVVEPVSVLYSENARMLAVHLDETPQSRDEIVRRAMSRIGEPYGWRAVVRKFVAILTGRDVRYFRWRFFGDAAATCMLIDVMVWHRPMSSWLLIAWAVVVVGNRTRWLREPLALDEYVTPDGLLALMRAGGAKYVVDGNAFEAQVRESPLA